VNANGIVVAPSEGPVWAMEPGRKSVLKLQNGDTEQSVMMFEETAPIGTVTPLHLHHDSDEVAYVLSGEITFKIGDEITVGGPGTCAFMPRDVSHAWKSTGAEPGRVLFLYTPGRAGGLFEELAGHVGVSLTPDDGEFVRIAERHGWEIVGPPPF
jgi:mannose-6-phosphate isomerase-like protein (cupin superfamily)